MPFVQLIPLGHCRRGGGVFVSRPGRDFAVFWLMDPERVFVIDNTCPHAGGDLSSGEVTGTIVACPYHFWEFDLRTGKCTHSKRARVQRYKAEIRNGTVWADLPDGST